MGRTIKRAGTVGLWYQGYLSIPLELWEAAGGSPAKGEAVQIGIDRKRKRISVKPLGYGAESLRDWHITTRIRGSIVMVWLTEPLRILGYPAEKAAGRYSVDWQPDWGLVLDLSAPLAVWADMPGAYPEGVQYYEVNIRRTPKGYTKPKRYLDLSAWRLRGQLPDPDEVEALG